MRSDRLSFTVFHQPNDDAVFDGIPTCMSAARPARYGTTTSGTHIAAKLKAMRSPEIGTTSPD